MAKQIYFKDRRFPPSVILGTYLPPAEDATFSGNVRSTPEKVTYTIVSNWTTGVVVAHNVNRCVFSADTEEATRIATATEFRKLRENWHEERGATSSITEMAMCRAHLQIIGLGPAAIPLILRQLEREGDEPDMWFVALQMLTRADPVTDEIRGDFVAMGRRWLDWAVLNGYAW
jgi:hypothetical protein